VYFDTDKEINHIPGGQVEVKTKSITLGGKENRYSMGNTVNTSGYILWLYRNAECFINISQQS
jgi:hypothetical protein